MIVQPHVVKVGSSSTPEGWYPPADWGWDAASALISDGDNGVVGLVACFPDVENYVTLYPELVSGSGTVDWGDGSAIENISGSAVASHMFDYASIPGVVTSEGFKVAVVCFNFTGQLWRVRFEYYHASEPAEWQSWLCIKLRSTYTGQFTYYNVGGDRAQLIHLLDIGAAAISGSYMLYNHVCLKKLLLNGSLITTNIDSMFRGCNVAYDFNSIDWSNVTDLSFLFYLYNGPLYALNISINSCTSINAAFLYAAAFRTIKLSNTGKVTNITLAIYSSYCRYFFMDDASSVTTTTNFKGSSLENLILEDLTVGVDLSNCKLSATALNAFFTALGTANGAQTITVTGNPGAATCDTTIATAKGFTVVT